jgi:23S rRNA (uridine2552-2'-O)-methyltransferase
VPNEWLRQRKKDQFHRLAKEKGYRSRASFKLLQIARKYRFIKRGNRVLDLGAVDKEPINPLDYPNVSTIVADVKHGGTIDQIQTQADGKFDAVISDLSPNISGVWNVDHARQIDLARTALQIARMVLRPSGNMLVKVFQGSELKDFQTEMRSSFHVMRIVKPLASRAESAELYLVGLEFVV